MLSAILPSTYPSPPPYSGGPGDIASSVWRAWFGWRGFSIASAATGTTKSNRLRRDSDDAEQDILILTTGRYDIANATSFAGGANLFLVTAYDQSGAGADVTLATHAAQPQFFLSGGRVSGIPYAQWSSTSAALVSTATFTFSKPVQFASVSQRTGQFTTQQKLLALGAGSFLSYAASANTIDANNGADNNFTCSDSVWHAIQVHLNGFFDSAIQIDATNNNLGFDSGTNSPSSVTLSLGSAGTFQFQEGGVLNSGWTATERTLYNTQIVAYTG